MRKIKFRAWDKEEGKMIYTNNWSGTYSFDFDNDASLKCCSNNPYCDTFGDEHDDWKVMDNIMQYTGLKDKNGKEIYEGDVLQCHGNSNDLVKVVYGDFGVFDVESLDTVDMVIGWHYEVVQTDAISRTDPFCRPMPLTDYYVDRCEHEVIGNIYENPEISEREE